MRVLLLLALSALPQDAEAFYKSARGKAAKSDFTGAIIDYTRALAEDPKLAPALVGRAEARRELKDLDGAIQDLNAALHLDPKDIEALIFRGSCRADLKDHAAALADFTRAIELGADAPVVFALRGIARESLERHEEALSDLDRAIAGGHRSSLVYSARSRTRLALLDFRGAVSDSTRSLQRKPQAVSPLVNRGIAYFALGSWDNAARDLREKFRVSESVSIWEAVLIFLARSRMGQKEGAGKELRVAREGLAADPEAAWARAVVDFLLGEGSVEQVEKAGDAKGRPLDAHLYVGFHHLLGGRRDEAEWRFERAVGGANEKPGFERIIARAELEKLRFERRAAVLDELEAKFRAQKPFRAEFRARDVSGEKDGRSITSFDVWYDRAASRLHVTLRGRDEQEGRDWEGHVATEGLSFLTWGILEKPYKMDATPFFRDLEKWDREIREEFDRLLPQGASRKDEAAPLEPVLVIQMEPKPARDQDGAFRFAVGKGGRPASWLREPRRPVGVAMEEKEGEVVFEISSPRKTIVVDRATGLLRSLRTLDYDGKAREILLSSFRTIEKFPEPDRPASFEPLPLDLSQFEGRWREQRGWLEALVGEGLDRWDDVTKAGRQREVQVLVIRWAARYADGLRTYALKTLARIHVRRRLDQGTPLADLAGDDEAARFAEACKGEAAEIERFIRGRLEDVVAEVETRAIESPIDSRRHGVLAELLKASFEYRTVEAERSKAYGDRTREALKEELDAQKRL